MIVEAPGFRNTERKDIELQVAQVARLDFPMQLGNVSDTIEVSGGAPVLESQNATLGTVIENKRIVDLPLNGRNPLQLVSLTPGATTNGPASSQGQQRMGGSRNQFALNVAGQRTSNNHYSLDGVENTDPNFNTYLFLPSVDALQEFKVETGTYGAEYGRGLSQVNMSTRSGTNEYTERCSSFCATRISTRKISSIPPDRSRRSNATNSAVLSVAPLAYRRSTTEGTGFSSFSITKDFANARHKPLSSTCRRHWTGQATSRDRTWSFTTLRRE
jgi:hypothetical protein